MKKQIIGAAIFFACLLLTQKATAGAFEYSLGFSFSKSNYSDNNFSWERRWGTSLGYHFTEQTEIEFAFQDIVQLTKITGFEDTKFSDQVYSVNWVQALLGKSAPVQPYFKLGVGQLNRDATGSYANGAAPARTVDSITVVLGAGLRIYLTRTFAIRIEGTSYLSGGSVKTWQDNAAINIGGSIYF